MSGDMGLEEMLRLAARITKEHGCEVRLEKQGDFTVRPLHKGGDAGRRVPMTSTERVRKHRSERKQALEKQVLSLDADQCKIMSDADHGKMAEAHEKEVKEMTSRGDEVKLAEESSLNREQCKIMFKPDAMDDAERAISGTEYHDSSASFDTQPTLSSLPAVSPEFEQQAESAQVVESLHGGEASGLGETETLKNVSVVLAPSFPPSPSSPRPPSTSPALSPGYTPARKRAPRRRMKRKMHAVVAAQAANAVPLPSRLDTPQFRSAWSQWCDHRSTLSALNPVKLWTAEAAQSTLAECAVHGEKAAAEAIRAGIANGWQGLIWERVLTLRKAMKADREGHAQGGRGYESQSRPRHQAYRAAEATRGLSAEQISGF